MNQEAELMRIGYRRLKETDFESEQEAFSNFKKYCKQQKLYKEQGIEPREVAEDLDAMPAKFKKDVVALAKNVHTPQKLTMTNSVQPSKNIPSKPAPSVINLTTHSNSTQGVLIPVSETQIEEFKNNQLSKYDLALRGFGSTHLQMHGKVVPGQSGCGSFETDTPLAITRAKLKGG